MPRARKSFDLFVPEPVEAPPPDTRSVPSKLQLWLAVCLPSLALESLSVAQLHEPAVVVEAEQVVASSEAAANAGVVPGMKLSTALALAASLQVFERTPALELASLESLAGWAESLTSTVSIEVPESVLLEVAGSLKLFGSVQAIKAKLEQELARRYTDFRLCVAPTATAALWLARAARTDVLEWRQLAGSLSSLPLTVTRWPPAILALLRDLGLRTVGECVRLPRDGLARRVGRSCLLELDRAYGRSVDLRAEFKPPQSWSSQADLGEETVDSAIFSEAIEQLLDELIPELRKRQVQIGSFELAFDHLHRPSTIESFDLREPTHDRQRLLHLIADRLERSVLPVPAVAVRMSSGPFKPLELEDAGLFEAKPFEQCEQMLLERLQERFGARAVYGLCVVAEHRPEKAWGKRSGTHGGRAQVGHGLDGEARPLWLLPVPVAIEARRGSLELCSGPERIESGWWDEQDVARDYYTAKNGDGQTLWIFRDHRTRSWFLHGLFG